MGAKAPIFFIQKSALATRHQRAAGSFSAFDLDHDAAVGRKAIDDGPGTPTGAFHHRLGVAMATRVDQSGIDTVRDEGLADRTGT